MRIRLRLTFFASRVVACNLLSRRLLGKTKREQQGQEPSESRGLESLPVSLASCGPGAEVVAVT